MRGLGLGVALKPCSGPRYHPPLNRSTPSMPGRSRSTGVSSPAPRLLPDLTRDETGAALAAAQRERLAKRRNLGVAVMQERLGDGAQIPAADWGDRLVRAINM